jgi:hypothetical protein
MGTIIPFPNRTGFEPWVTKRELARHLRCSTRWIELRQREGLPSILLGGRRRYRISVIQIRNGKFCVQVYDPALKRKVWVGTYSDRALAEGEEAKAKAARAGRRRRDETCDSFAKRWLE